MASFVADWYRQFALARSSCVRDSFTGVRDACQGVGRVLLLSSVCVSLFHRQCCLLFLYILYSVSVSSTWARNGGGCLPIGISNLKVVFHENVAAHIYPFWWAHQCRFAQAARGCQWALVDPPALLPDATAMC